MTKLRRFSRNLARAGLPLLNLCILLSAVSGCSSSTKPTYPLRDLGLAIENVCNKEYAIQVRAKLVAKTLWVYMPVENLISPADKPEKFVKKFLISANQNGFEGTLFKSEYLIKNIPDQEITQEIKLDKSASEKSNNVLQVIRRVLFSMEKSRQKEPRFFCLVISDIKNGYEMIETFFLMDLKKVFYGYISREEFQHRILQDFNKSDDIIGDMEGKHIQYRNITMPGFISAQIKHRIELKFDKPEVAKNVNVDKEVLKIVSYVFDIYGFKDFSEVELTNLLTNNKVSFNQGAILGRPTEQKF